MRRGIEASADFLPCVGRDVEVPASAGLLPEACKVPDQWSGLGLVLPCRENRGSMGILQAEGGGACSTPAWTSEASMPPRADNHASERVARRRQGLAARPWREYPCGPQTSPHAPGRTGVETLDLPVRAGRDVFMEEAHERRGRATNLIKVVCEGGEIFARHESVMCRSRGPKVTRKGFGRSEPMQVFKQAHTCAGIGGKSTIRTCCPAASFRQRPSSAAFDANEISPEDRNITRQRDARRADPSRELRDLPVPLASMYATSPTSRDATCDSSSRQSNVSQ